MSNALFKGERLSHAVGCAFAVCLERKKKRDAEAVLAVQAAAGLIPPSQCSDKSSNAPATTSAGFTLSNNIKSTTTASNMTSNTSAISSNK
ncbi:unnamed protein product [Anisakis simplex]|uniref:Auxin_canalis domain-containing protein n=1 Tax=Anisakis simplex TaxID=6269 RepID=A0A0M3JPA7_ANISI|nr:unnamed protein product [Anisakis simplex]